MEINKDTIKSFESRYLLCEDGCFIWKRNIDGKGYGNFSYKGKRILAHRFSFRAFKSKIPKDLVVDHMCKNKLCVNPKHLRLLTRVKNVMIGKGIPALNAKKSKCKNGHNFSGKNLLIRKNMNGNKKRKCRICCNLTQKKYYDSRTD